MITLLLSSTKWLRTYEVSRKEILSGLVLPFLFLAGCTQEALIVSLKDNDIAGTATMFKANGTLSNDAGSLNLSCSSAVASLHAVNADGSITNEALASSPIDGEGNYKLSFSSGVISLRTSQVRYVVKAVGCGSEFCRPVTDLKDQLVTGASTLVCMASDVDGKRSLGNLNRDELKSALTSFSSISAPTLLDLVDSVIANNSLAGLYQQITGVAATKLKELPPSSVSYTAPLNIHESTANTYQASINHWNSDYNVAYQWKLDGQIVGTLGTYTYSPGQNAQGPHQLVLTIGSKDSGGNLDATKPTKSEVFNVTVANDYPALPPSISLNSPATSGLPISSRSLTLDLNTGISLSHCATFSKLALTENSASPPATSAFDITCDTAGNQSLSYTLSSSGDGTKVLRLWAMDAAGNISVAPTTLSIDLDTAAPIALITSTLPNITNATAQSISFSANDNGGSIDHFQCKLDSGSYVSCSTPKTFSGLTQGVHTAAVRAIDTAGNISTDVTASWTVDLTEPTLSFSSTPSPVTNSLSSSFSFSGSDTGGGSIARYECKLDSASYTVCTSPKINVLAAGSHTLLIKAFDTAGNISNVLSYSWTIDTALPTASIAAKPASVTNSQSAAFSFSGSDTGGAVVASYECSLDGGAYSACTSPRSYSGLTAGAHSFSVRAIDSAGNTGNATSYSWTIDLSTPMASINSGPDSITNQTSATFAFSANPPPAGSIIGYQCSLDGAAYSACTSPATYTGLAQGDHTFGVKSVDNNSALSDAVTESWKVDTTSPTLTVTSAPSAINNSTAVNITFSASDSGSAVAGYECKLNSGSYASCTSPVTLSGLIQGTQTYSVRATDAAGNISTPAVTSWVTDLTGPSISISSTPNAITNSQSASFSFSGSDTGGSSVASYLCSIDNGSFMACASPVGYSSLSAGAHSFAVKALDGTGNEGTIASFNWTIDRTNPTVTITSSPNAQANSTSANFSFSGSDTGGGTIASYECSVDGGSFAACTSPRSLSGLSQGAHTFNVRSLDTAGNVSSTATLTWNVDTVAPTLAISIPATDGTVVPSSSLTGFTISGTCESGINVVFSGVSTSNAACVAGTWSTLLDLSALADGTLSLTATQTDAAGNSTSRTRTFIKDTLAPSISLISVPATTQKGGTSYSIGFSVTEANITTAQSFTVAYSTNNGSSWTNASGSVASTNGPLAATTFSYSLTLPAVDSSQVKIRVSGSDSAGNLGTSSASSPFTIDSTSPTLSSFSVNGGNSNIGSSSVPVSFTGSDNRTVTHFCLKYNSTTAPLAADTCWKPMSFAGVSANASVNVTNYYFNIGLAAGSYQIAGWLKDDVGNISSLIQNPGQDIGSVFYTPPNPPVVGAVIAVSNDSPSSPASSSDLTIPSGSTVYIKWNASASGGFSATGIEISYSTDDTTWTPITSVANGVNGSCTLGSYSGCYVWTNASPSSNFFRVRIKATDLNGYSAQLSSQAINSNYLRFISGNTDSGIGGSSSSFAFKNNDPSDDRYRNYRAFVIHPSGDIYFRDEARGILKIGNDGTVRTLVPMGASSTGNNVVATSATVSRPSAIHLGGPQNNYLYIWDMSLIRQVNLAANPPTIKTLVGGSSPSSSADTLADARYLSMPSASFGAAGLSNFYALPNGDIIFRDGSYGGSSTNTKIRWYHATDGSVTSVYFNGTNFHPSYPSLNISECNFRATGPILDPVSGELTGFLAQVATGPSSAGVNCTAIASQDFLVKFNLSGSVVQSPGATFVDRETQYVLGLDYKLYRQHAGNGSIESLNSTHDGFTSIMASGLGQCADDTPVSSCKVQLVDTFVDQNGKISFLEIGRIRYIDSANKVQTLTGVSCFEPVANGLSSRLCSLDHVATWNDGTTDRYTFLASALNKFFEVLSSNLTLSLVAGDGTVVTSDTNVSPTATGFYNLVDTSKQYSFGLDPSGNIYAPTAKYKIGKLTRSTNRWSDFVGGGATNYASADGASGTSISFQNAAFRILGWSNSSLLVSVDTNINYVKSNTMIKKYSASAVQSAQAGIVATNLGDSWCAVGTASNSCNLRSVASRLMGFAYDPFLEKYFISVLNDASLRALTVGGTMQQYLAVPKVGAMAVRKKVVSGTTTEDIFYYCDSAGKLWKKDNLANTTIELTMPTSTMLCAGSNMVYNEAQNRLLFIYTQNGLYGLAEHLAP